MDVDSVDNFLQKIRPVCEWSLYARTELSYGTGNLQTMEAVRLVGLKFSVEKEFLE